MNLRGNMRLYGIDSAIQARMTLWTSGLQPCNLSAATLLPMFAKPLCAAALFACLLFLLGSVTQSPDPCAATQDFVYPLAAPLLILGSFGWLGVSCWCLPFAGRWPTRLGYAVLYAVVSVVLAVGLWMGAMLAVLRYEHLMPFLLEHDCYGDATPSMLGVTVTGAIAMFLGLLSINRAVLALQSRHRKSVGAR
ncbi:hypothetical protein ASC78_02080 [Variovorax sp. Root318D1]|uniref:hypothetical protein n=1 Tax=Variovorax sp. Root318D1 TaxID=1736513 RepID=UPI0006F24FD8|nr:hypothetical protein [Variovorax sp. Root318D1]KQU91733.1 hypothetical protein ASC78_02080 [Variovorax sp. Root318D1]